MENPYDKLRFRFSQFNDELLYQIVSEDVKVNGYQGDKKYEQMLLNIINNYTKYHKFAEKQKMVVINYLIH